MKIPDYVLVGMQTDRAWPVATRPMIMQKYGEYTLFYTHDGNKNVSDLVFFQRANGIAAHYEYAPFGAVTATSSSTPVTAYDFRTLNPYRFSSEWHDDTLGLVYYNFRHLDCDYGRWMSRDPEEVESVIPRNTYGFLINEVLLRIDYLGKNCFPADSPKEVENADWELSAIEFSINDQALSVIVVEKYKVRWKLRGTVKCCCTSWLGLLKDHYETRVVEKIYVSESVESLHVLRSANLPVLVAPSPSSFASLVGEASALGWIAIIDGATLKRSFGYRSIYLEAQSTKPDDHDVGRWPGGLCE